MLLHNILTTKDERLIKEIIEDQINNTWKGCWMEQTKEICMKYNIVIQNIRLYTKDKLKEVVKNKIRTKLEEEIKVIMSQKTKLRFLNSFEQKTYLEELDYCDSIDMIKIRLNMMETKCNYKGKSKQTITCEVCKMADDTTEHILQCKETRQYITTKVADIKIAKYEIVKQIKEVMKRREELGHQINIGGTEDSSESEEEVED